MFDKSQKYILFLFLLGVFSCTNKIKDVQRTPLVEVNGHTLYQDELENLIPKSTNMIDSANLANRYLEKWVTTILVYDNAKNNVSDIEKIEKLVEKYRQDLIIHQYEQSLVGQRMDTNLTNEELTTFYENFKSHLLLEEHFVKGLLLITPTNIPNIDKVREWVKLATPETIEKIEKYGLKNAVSFDYFDQEWQPFNEIIKKIPIFTTKDSRSFLLNNRFYETKDSTKHYFLRLSEVALKGDIQPFDKAKEKMKDIIINRKKREFIQGFESTIYDDAVKSGKVKFLLKEK